MGTVTARAAAEADIEAIGAVARASGLGPRDSGADPDYVRHLLLHGQVAVSVVDDAVTGFGATLPVGGTTMLCDLFVRPDAQDGGAGAALLELLFDGVDRRMTFASRDPRAMALYTRFRMAGRWVLFYLRATGAAGPAPAGTVCVPAGAAEVATLELAWTGIDRGADHRYWASRPGGHGFVVRRDGLPVATGSLAEGEDGTALAHLAVSPDADPVEAVVTALAAAPERALVHLPSVHPAVPVLLGQGYRIEEYDLFMADSGMPGGERGAYSPGFC
jgi:hypothetical protein